MDLAGLNVEVLHKRFLELPLACPRRGIMLHYDDSSRDDWALEWFEDPRCRNAYTWLVLDDGRVVELADPAKRTQHAGPCITPMANSVFYGVAAATNGLVLVSEAQRDAIVGLCVSIARHHGWKKESVARRIIGHDAQAIWTPDTTPYRERWGRLGRKVDPTGIRPDKQPIIDVAAIRRLVSRSL
jgi:N-acetyl-anhydromuramyl-L-alanine amidase AmpD